MIELKIENQLKDTDMETEECKKTKIDMANYEADMLAWECKVAGT